VEDLKGFTEEKLMAFVKTEGGPNGQVPAWLEQPVPGSGGRILLSFLKNDKVASLSSQFSRASLGDRAHFSLMRFTDQEKGLKAERYEVESESWDTLMDALRSCVREKFNEQVEDDRIHFCCYIKEATSRTEFNGVGALKGGNIRDNCVLFWTGAPKDRPVSPEKLWKDLKEEVKQNKEELKRVEKQNQKELKRVEKQNKEEVKQNRKEVALLRDELQRVKLVSSTQAMQEEFDKHIQWKIGELEEWLKGEVKLIQVSVMEASKVEDAVQRWWKNVLLANFSTMKDTHAKCNTLVGRDGTMHKPDFTMTVGPSILWEKIDRVFELKPSIVCPAERRDVVVQLYARLVEVFDHQPERVVAYGIALDHANVCFVRAERDLSSPNVRRLYVSDCLNLFEKNEWSIHGRLLLRFLALSARECGFVEVVLPRILDVQMESVLCRRPDGVVYLAGGLVFKKSKRAAREVAFLRELSECLPRVCPSISLFDEESFAMGLGQDSRSVEHLDLNRLTSDLFWGIYQLHEKGISHCDIKPSNVVLMDGSFCLIDFDAAIHLNRNEERTRYTKEFATSTMLSEREETDWDLVGLFWTVTFFYARQCAGHQWRSSHWTEETRFKWGWEMITNEKSVLRRLILVPAALTAPCTLMHPRRVMSLYLELTRDAMSSWIDSVRKLETEKGWPPCPLHVLERCFNKRYFM
jgi:hypothetical protein